MCTKTTIIWGVVPEIARQTEFFAILDNFLPFYPPNNLENQNFEKRGKIWRATDRKLNFEKNVKNAWRYYPFARVYQKIVVLKMNTSLQIFLYYWLSSFYHHWYMKHKFGIFFTQSNYLEKFWKQHHKGTPVSHL